MSKTKTVKLSANMRCIIEDNNYTHVRHIDGRGLCGIKSFMFTTAIVYGIDESGYSGRFCFERPFEAILSFREWNGMGDPPWGWIIHKGIGGDYANPKNKQTF